MFRPIAAMALLALAPAARAQTQDLLEYREFETEEGEKKLTVDGSFETAWYEYDNLDFRPLDESSDQAILDSDDRGGFPFTGASLNLAYEVEPGVEFFFAGSHRGLWGGDQIGGTNVYGNIMYITSLYGAFTLKPTAERSVRIDVGRRNYKLGGLASGRDYILQDTLDMVLVDVPLGTVGSLELIPIDVLEQTDNDGQNFVNFIGTADLPTFNFRGDTLMRRHGAVLRLDELPGPVDALAYGFYTDIGAGVSAPQMGLFSSGVDITYQGLLGNFTDNDWVANFGLRGSLNEVGPVDAWAHFDASVGIDRKELVARDVNTNGLAWGAGLSVDTRAEQNDEEPNPSGAFVQADYFDAFGAAYDKDGLMYSHGYVGMKAQQVGGHLFNRFLGFHPTAYVGIFGVSDTPNEPSRKAGTRALHAHAGYDAGRPWVMASWWFLQDTAISDLQLGRIDQIDPPFGYARDEFRAQARVGKTIGQELNLDGGYQITEKVALQLGGGVILPAEYYSITVARVAGDALGFDDPAMPWAFMGGLDVDF